MDFLGTDNAKSGSPWEPLLSPIVVGAWSHLWLGLVQINILAGQTDRCVPNILKIIPVVVHEAAFSTDYGMAQNMIKLRYVGTVYLGRCRRVYIYK